MEAFQAASSALALVDLCVKLISFIRNVRRVANTVLGELDTLINEIVSLQNVSKLIVDLSDVFVELGQRIPSRHAQTLKDLDSGVLLVVNECQRYIRDTEDVILQVRSPTSGVGNIVDAGKTVWRRNSKREDLDRLRHNIQSGQSRIQAFYISMNIIQVQATTTSITLVSDEVRKLGFQLMQQMSLIRHENGGQSMNDNLPGLAGLLGPVRLNKHFDVPRLVDSFYTGRQALLQELKVAFDQPRTTPTVSPRVFVVHGFPGSGKTDFSFKFAEQYRESFWGVFVLQGDSHDFMVSSFERMVQFTSKRVEPNMAAVKHWLANQDLPWLLIIDNADDPELDMTKYFPANQAGCIIITTRNRDLRRHGNVGRRSFNFERLRRDEAKTVLLRAADAPNPPSVSTESAASQISEELQCLPLALVSAGKTIRSKLCTWKSYLGWYQESCDSVSKQLGSGSSLTEIDKSRLTVISTIEPHFARLEKLNDRVSSDALELIFTLGYFHHRNIGFKLLRLVAINANKVALGPTEEAKSKSEAADRSSHNPSFESLKARAQATLVRMASGRATLPEVLRTRGTNALDELRLRAALNKLENLNLIRCDDRDSDDVGSNRSPVGPRRINTSDTNYSIDADDADYTYSLHPLVQSWVRQRHSRLWKRAVWCEAANTALAQCVVLETAAFTGGQSSYFNARELLPHIKHARKCSMAIDQQLAMNAMNIQGLRGFLSKVYSVPTDLNWLSKLGEAQRNIKYSLVYSLCGNFGVAAELQSHVRSFVVSKRGMNDPISIHLTLALASTMQKLTEFGQAAALQDEVVQACLKVYGPKHPLTLTMIDQKGLLLLYHGRLRESEQSHQEAYDGLSQLGDEYKRQSLIAKAHLGAVRARHMKFEESKGLCQEAIAGLESLNPNDEEILWAKEALALSCGELGQGSEAHELMQDVYQKRKKSLGDQHPYTLWAAVNQSRALWRMKSYDLALKLLDQPREDAARSLGRKHFGYLAGESLRACILKDQGKYVEAQDIFMEIDKTYEELKRERGVDHADRITTLGHQLDLYVVQGLYRDAILTGNRIIDMLRSINAKGWGMEHPFRYKVEEKLAELQSLCDHQSLSGGTGCEGTLRQRSVASRQAVDESSPSAQQDLMRFISGDVKKASCAESGISSSFGAAQMHAQRSSPAKQHVLNAKT